MSDSTSTYINPLTDFGFKYIFGRHAEKKFTLSFLNALIGDDIPITDIEFIDKEKKGESKDDKALIYDLHCILKDGSKIIVEIQNRYQTHFDDRAIYYLAADLYAQSEKGDDWNYRLTPVYGVFLMNFEWRNVDEQHLREDVCLYNMQTKKVFSDKMRMTFLKIPMMHKDAEACETTLERWMYLLKNMEKMEALPQSFAKDPVFRDLNRVARYAALTDKDKKAYKESLKAYRDAYAIYETEQAIGEARGIQIGEARGIQIGESRGKAEERRKSIRMMLSFGLSARQIAEKYQMTEEEVMKIGESN